MTQKHDPFIFSLELLLDAVAALPSFIIKKNNKKKLVSQRLSYL